MANLELRCTEDDGGPDRSESVALTDHEEFRCPELKCLVIDGRNCYEACRSNPQWTDKIANILGLHISNFHPSSGESFSSHELLHLLLTFSNLQYLGFTDLVLHPSPDLDMPHPNPFSVRFLDLEDLHGFEVMGQIIRFLNDPYHISFTRCTFGDMMDEFHHFANRGGGGELNLTDIDCDLAPLFRLWHGHLLNVTDCPRFDDTLLDAMSSKESGSFNCAIHVEDLKITDCSNFSFAALRRFVESRLHPVDNPSIPVSPRIRSIRFFGNVPSRSRAEQASLDANLRGFFD
jgi:hypothetical protein